MNTGSLRWGTINLMAYFYMVLSWGGYSFVINLIPIYVLACIVTGRVTARHYVAFAPLVFVGTLLAGESVIQSVQASERGLHFVEDTTKMHPCSCRDCSSRAKLR